MMYDELFYFDGCSYMRGHDDRTNLTQWINTINPLVDKDGNLNKALDHTNSQCHAKKKPFYDFSETAKSNYAIFEDFTKTKDILIKANNVQVVIMWSHSERKPKDKNQDFIHPDGWTKDKVQEWFSGFKRTVDYMYQVQEFCKEYNIQYNCITTEHPQLFEWAREYNDNKYSEQLDKIEDKFIFNWPGKRLENYTLDFKTYEDVITLWGCTSFPLAYCKAFNEDIDKDMKHMGDSARLRFGAHIHDWVKDRSKDLSYCIDESVKPVNKRYVYDLKPWLESYIKGNCTHWVEKELKQILLTKEIRPNADFIYES